jgi:hypothetical protein
VTPNTPSDQQLAWLYARDASGRLVFVTREPDGLYYVWIRDSLESTPTWTYAYRHRRSALAQMRTTAGYRHARPERTAGEP